MKNSINTSGNLTRDLPARRGLPQPTALPLPYIAYSVQLLIQISEYTGYSHILNLALYFGSPNVIVGNRKAARTNSDFSGERGTTLATQPSDVISTSVRLSTLVAHRVFLLYSVTNYHSLNCTHIGNEGAARLLII
jgi:hypothetical protein